MPSGHFVPGLRQVSEDQLLLRKFCVNQCLKRAVELHPVREGIANQRNMISFLQGQGGGGESGHAGQGNEAEEAEQFFHG